PMDPLAQPTDAFQCNRCRRRAPVAGSAAGPSAPFVAARPTSPAGALTGGGSDDRDDDRLPVVWPSLPAAPPRLTAALLILNFNFRELDMPDEKARLLDFSKLAHQIFFSCGSASILPEAWLRSKMLWNSGSGRCAQPSPAPSHPPNSLAGSAQGCKRCGRIA